MTNPNPAGLSVGAVIGGRYEIIPYRPPENPSQERGYIGAGGMGVVYLAIDNRLDRKIAIKTTLKADEDSAARFVREIKAAASLNHPGIVQPLDCGTENGIAYFAMEFVEGGRSLHAWIQEHKKNATKSSLDVVVDLFVRISDALWCIHDAGFVHRDIKPSNILLMRMPHRDELVPKISDFGVVRSFEGGEMNLTLTGQACGTPHYQSPETVRYLRGDDVVLDARVDLWALVVSLCECLTCAKPFNGQDATQAHKAVLEHRPLWPSEARDDIERGMHIDHICMKGLEKDPTLRFHNAKDLHHALMHVNQLPIYAGDNLKTSVALGGSAAGNAHLLVMPELNNGLRFPGETVAAKKPEPNNNIVQNNQPPPSVTDADPDEAPQDSAPLRDASPATAENRLPRRTLVPVLAIAAVPALLLFVGLTMLGGGAEPQFSEPTITTDDAQEPARRVSYRELIRAEKKARQEALLVSASTTPNGPAAPTVPTQGSTTLVASRDASLRPEASPRNTKKADKPKRTLRRRKKATKKPSNPMTADGIEILPDVGGSYSFASANETTETPRQSTTHTLRPSPRPCAARLDLTWTSQAAAPAFVVLEEVCGDLPKGTRLRGRVTYQLGPAQAQLEIVYREMTLPDGRERAVHAITYDTDERPGLRAPITWQSTRLKSEAKETVMDVLDEFARDTRLHGDDRLLHEKRDDTQRARERWAVVQLPADTKLKVLVLEVRS